MLVVAGVFHASPKRSPSSRRAWIEISETTRRTFLARVALLAEGVDRNQFWQCLNFCGWVALLAEGVDRNICGEKDRPLRS